jgi:arsenate reductase
MAEGWTRHLKGDVIDVRSAGITPKGLDPHAIRVMREVGVDISSQRSKSVTDLSRLEFDYVITVCNQADENCPVFPGNTRRLHFGFDDPPRLAQGSRTDDEALKHYRRVRDEIRALVEKLPDILLE